MRQPTTTRSTVTVEFIDPEYCRQVNDLIANGWSFQRAVEYLELRPLTHYSVTRTDTGPDGRG